MAVSPKFGVMALANQLRRGGQHQVPGTYVIVHVGTQLRFVSGVSLIFVSGAKSGDYHVSMYGDNFEHWLLTQLPNLEEPSLIALDSTLCHIVLPEKPFHHRAGAGIR